MVMLSNREAAEKLAMELRDAMNRYLTSRPMAKPVQVEFLFTDVTQVQSPGRQFIANVTVKWTDEATA
jgi:hypothetical protein